MNDWAFHCKILGISPDASKEEIKKAYMAQAKLFHPDKHQDSTVAKDKFQQLQESYNYLINNQNLRSQNDSPSEPLHDNQSNFGSKKKKSSKWVWMYVIVFFLMLALTALWFTNKSTNTPDPNTNLTSNDIENILKDFRLFTYRMTSNQKDCIKLSRDDPDYHDIISSKERFPNTNCGDVRAFIRSLGTKNAITVISPTIEGCRCQVEELKKKPKVNPNKSSFSNKDL